MDVDPGGVFLCQFHDTHVCDDERIDAGVFGGGQELRERVDLFIAGQRVHREVDPDALLMTVPDRFDEALFRKVGRCRPHAEFLSAEVYRVRSVEQGRVQALPVPRRGQELRYLNRFQKMQSPYSSSSSEPPVVRAL